MAHFRSILHAFAVATLISMFAELSAHEFTPEDGLFRAITVGTNLRGLFAPRGLVNSTRPVLNSAMSLLGLLKYQNSLDGSDSEEQPLGSVVLQEVVDDSCTWLKSILEDVTFNCTETDVESLVIRMRILQSLTKSENALRRIISEPCSNRRCRDEWVKNKIPCEGDGKTARNYLKVTCTTE